ncbi:MAG: hypothetical protein PHD05_05155 [Sphaerochaetaceae bacterium]|nr:hypothetical protein [Sphaerochaetaceae bacterium]
MQKVESYINQKGLGIHILSVIGKNAKTDLQISMIRTDSHHTKETFKQIFVKMPQIKKDLKEMFDEEECTIKKQKKIEEDRVKKMVR